MNPIINSILQLVKALCKIGNGII